MIEQSENASALRVYSLSKPDDTANCLSGNIKIFSCNANKALAQAIAKKLNLELGLSEVTTFSDGEIHTRIDETIRGADVYIIQSTCTPVNDNLMELLIMIDAMKRASAGHINAVIPYFGYARQDRKTRARDPISAKLVANLITTAGADRVIAMDLHCSQIQGFFDIPVDHLLALPIFANYYKEKFGANTEDVIVVSPDLGSVARSRALADRLDVPLAIVDKRRPKANVSKVVNIIGDIKDKRIIMVDDMIDTGGSITNAANVLMEKGAKEIFACCTHPLFSGNAIKNIEQSAISELIIIDTIPHSPEELLPKIKYLSSANIFSEAILRVHSGSSLSELFV